MLLSDEMYPRDSNYYYTEQQPVTSLWIHIFWLELGEFTVHFRTGRTQISLMSVLYIYLRATLANEFPK